MGHLHDYWESIRLWLIPKLGTVTQWLEDVTGRDLYVTAETHNRQFVGRVPIGEEEFEKVLHDMGFERNPLAALKNLPSGEVEEGSWRKVGYDKHPRKQLHVIIYDGSKIQNAETGHTYVYAHWEYRWDTNPMKHYRSVDMDPDEGVKRMKDLLDQNGIVYEPIRP
jgi:hypothetical protein